MNEEVHSSSLTLLSGTPYACLTINGLSIGLPPKLYSHFMLDWTPLGIKMVLLVSLTMLDLIC